ncbi:HTH_Tnp_Tc3_2 domain-containing protein [Trichonephila clavipes]|nr:HTH_Tnp_Tc3_2 domain-containing protein [Trichonephila clavipes]
MGNLPDLDAFDHRQIVCGRCMSHSISEIVRQLGISRSTVSRVYREYMDDELKTNDRANCKWQLALTVRGTRRLRRIARSQRSQALAQITSQLNDGSSGIVANELCNTLFTACVSAAIEPLLNARHRTARLTWAREHRDWSVEDWTRLAWSDESRFSDYLTPTGG